MIDTSAIQRAYLDGLITVRQAMLDIRDLTQLTADIFTIGTIKMITQNPDWGEPEDGAIWQ